MARQFRLRVREGHTFQTYSDDSAAALPCFEPGDEFIVPEHVATTILRNDHRSVEVVGIIDDDDDDAAG